MVRNAILRQYALPIRKFYGIYSEYRVMCLVVNSSASPFVYRKPSANCFIHLPNDWIAMRDNDLVLEMSLPLRLTYCQDKRVSHRLVCSVNCWMPNVSREGQPQGWGILGNDWLELIWKRMCAFSWNHIEALCSEKAKRFILFSKGKVLYY